MLELSQGDVIEMTEDVREGTMTVTAEVLHRTTRTEKPDRPHFEFEMREIEGWMFEIQKIEVDGEDVTDEYLKKAFDGEKVRGIPDEKLKQQDIEVIK